MGNRTTPSTASCVPPYVAICDAGCSAAVGTLCSSPTMEDDPMSGSENQSIASGQEVATLGGGCFWCLDAVFRDLRGVTRVHSGYAGGHVANPTYEQVCGKRTGHAEVVQVT